MKCLPVLLNRQPSQYSKVKFERKKNNFGLAAASGLRPELLAGILVNIGSYFQQAGPADIHFRGLAFVTGQ